MINRITDLDAGRGTPDFYVPDPADRRPPWAHLGERIGKCVGDHPVSSLAIGLVVGIAIGCLLKRR